MKFSFFIFLSCFWTINFAQSARFIQSVTGKSIAFKTHYDSVKADYSANKEIVVINESDTINLDFGRYTTHTGFEFINDLTAKIDLKLIDNDTIMFIYSFFKNRLFAFDIYCTNDSLAKFYYSEFIKDVNKSKLKTHEPTMRTNGKGVSKDFSYLLRYDYKKQKFQIETELKKISKFTPLWCYHGKPGNWSELMEKELNSH